MHHPSNHREHQHTPATEGAIIRWAGIYDLFVNRIFGGLSHRTRVGALQHAGLKPGSTILDFGCGAGDLAFEAEQMTGGAGQIIGIDPSPEMVKVARQKAARKGSKAAFQIEAVENMTFPDGKFDVVISSFVLHHLPGGLQEKAFKEIKRVLKPGGLFFAIDMKPTRTFANRIHAHLQGGSGEPVSSLQQAASALGTIGFSGVEVGDTPSKSVGYVRGIAS